MPLYETIRCGNCIVVTVTILNIIGIEHGSLFDRKLSTVLHIYIFVAQLLCWLGRWTSKLGRMPTVLIYYSAKYFPQTDINSEPNVTFNVSHLYSAIYRQLRRVLYCTILAIAPKTSPRTTELDDQENRQGGITFLEFGNVNCQSKKATSD
jgi:hypothetical protein